MSNLKINPWREVWLHPRNTIKAILKYNPKYMVLPIVILANASAFLSDIELVKFASEYSYIGLALIGAMLGVAMFYLAALLYSITGQWIGGKADALKLRAAIAWSMLPMAAGSILVIPFVFAVRNNSFAIISSILLIFQILIVWAFILHVGMISEVQKFSIWKAILNGLLASMLLVLPILMLFVSLFASFG